MKLSKISLIRIATVLVAAACLGGCVIAGVVINNNTSNTASEVTVDHIEITKNPNKMDYYVGESFSRSGMVVTAFYSDSSSKKVMNYTIDKTEPLTLEDSVVTISFKGKTVTLTINISEKEVKTQIHVQSDKTYTYKVEAEDLPLASEEIGTDKSQYYEYHDSSNGNPSTSGGVSLGKLNYTAETIFLRVKSDVEAKANVVLSMAFNPSLAFDDSVETKWNDQIVTTGFDVKVTEGAAYVWFDWKEYTISNLSLKKGINELSLRLKDTSKLSPNYDYVKLEVNPIDESKVTAIEVTQAPTKTSYVEGEKFDSTGMVISAVLEDGNKIAINDYELSKSILSYGDTKITIIYKKRFMVDVPLTVTRAEIDHLILNQAPTISTYYIGQKFDPTGLKIAAVSLAGSKQDVSSFVSFDKAYLAKGDTKVTATYNSKTVDIPVTVLETTNLAIASDTNSKYRIEAEDAFWVKGPLCDKTKYNVVDDTNASGGKRLDSLDWLKDSLFLVNIESEVNTSVKISVSCDGPGLTYSETNPMTFNGNTVALKENPTGGWLNFKEYEVDGLLDLHVGVNTFIVNISNMQSVNFDYFEFEVNPKLETIGLSDITVDYSNVKTNYHPGETFDSTGLIVNASYEDGTSKTVTDYKIEPETLTLETTQVVVSWNGKIKAIPVQVAAHLTISETGTYRLEAEEASWEKGATCDKEKYNVVDDASASGGKRLDSLDWLSGSAFTITINAQESKTFNFVICSDGGGAGGNISNFASIKLNEVEDISFTTDLTGGWGNLQTITSNDLTLEEGLNTITISLTGSASVNYDYFEIVVK